MRSFGLRLATAAFVVSAVSAAVSCARVKPYQRETHASRVMQDQGSVDRKLDEHVHEYREGSAGARGVGGGGCGCN